jgi:two-component system response regulator
MSIVRGERRPTILLIEDNQDEEAMTMRAIRRSTVACQVLVAHSTDEALDYLFGRSAFAGRESRNPDVIVTDFKIGPMGGAELISEIRGDPRTRLIPVVVLTGSASSDQIDDLYRRGANSLLEKPVEFDEFTTAVTRLARYWGLLNTSVPANPAVANYPYPL